MACLRDSQFQEILYLLKKQASYRRSLMLSPTGQNEKSNTYGQYYFHTLFELYKVTTPYAALNSQFLKVFIWTFVCDVRPLKYIPNHAVLQNE